MISITRTTPGGEGYDVVVLQSYRANSSIRSGQARVSKNKTLDGGVVVIHNGFVEGDRSMEVATNKITRAQRDALWDLFSTQTFVNVAFEEGVWDAVISSLSDDGGRVRMTIEFKEKFTA